MLFTQILNQNADFQRLYRSGAFCTLGSALLGWGGLCVHFQSAAVTAPADLRLGGRLRGKLLHALLSAAVTWILSPYLLNL